MLSLKTRKVNDYGSCRWRFQTKYHWTQLELVYHGSFCRRKGLEKSKKERNIKTPTSHKALYRLPKYDLGRQFKTVPLGRPFICTFQCVLFRRPRTPENACNRREGYEGSRESKQVYFVFPARTQLLCLATPAQYITRRR